MSKVVAIFLSEFDMKSGYKLQWSYTTLQNFSFDAVEYKSLPSGIHDFKNATTFISHKSNNKIYYGLSCFKQFQINKQDDSNDRNNLKMFSIGILCEPTKNEWRPNEFINNGWEYIDEINEVLDKLEEDLIKNKGIDFNDYSNVLKNIGSTTNLTVPKESSNVTNHLLLNLPKLFEYLGPLIFTIYKQSLLRKNILIFNECHHNNNQQDTYHIITSFSYLISILSVIPKEIKVNKNLSAQQPLYNIGLNESSTGLLKDYKLNGYIAVTSDEILKTHPVYDIGVEIENNKSRIFKQSNETQSMKSTIRDYNKFQSLYCNLMSKEIKFTNKSNISTDDLNSINSRNDDEEISRNKSYTDISPNQIINEPSWWKSDAIETITWSESFWFAFSWFASAGQQLNEDEDEDLIDLQTKNKKILDLIDLLNIIGFFHKLTIKWFKYIDELIIETNEELQLIKNDFSSLLQEDQDQNQDQELTNKINLNISYQDMIEMELDPYSLQDIEFLKEFILLYYNNKVDNVNIGYNLTKICC
ncbi:hypothetical protein KGF54_002478 [Candida jiufengensis]|uniref:uncharacterized protein n=1 Tax=Candida jiufengensis TaxID=497108 RepID=UPI002224FC0A|nr:uncharacterized protein KGF54_002478 [Candida jiufengensis]KAI5953107.1 hypothetical protein KGF54_002478 [Candida jiufengensis]